VAYLATQYRISILEAVNQAFGTAGDVTFLTDVANGVDVEQPFAVRALECALLLMAVLRASEFLYWMLLFADKLRLSLEFETEGGSEYLRSVDAARAYMLDASETGQVLDVLRKGLFADEAFPVYGRSASVVGLFVWFVTVLAVDPVVGSHLSIVVDVFDLF